MGGKRVLRGRRKVRQKKPASANNAKPKKVRLMAHGGDSASLMQSPLDGRTRLAKKYKATIAAMRAHLGHSLTLPEEQLVEQVARFSLLCDISWRELIRGGMLQNGQLAPAFVAWEKAAKNQRDIFQMLGLKRRQKEIQDLSNYIAEQEQAE